MVDRVGCSVLGVCAIAPTDDGLHCSDVFLRSFNHSAKSVASRVTVRIALLKDFRFNAQSVRARFFSLICSKNRTISCRSCLLDEGSLVTTGKSGLLSTN